jgi:hypothetical protein
MSGAAAACDENESEERERREDRGRPPRKSGRLHSSGQI